MKKNRHARMYEEIAKHGQNLIHLFSLPADTDPVILCKKLKRLETKAHHATTCLCNTNTLNMLGLNRFTGYDVHQATDEEQDEFFDKILNGLDKILNFRAQNIPVFINYDPRGYALKIKSEWTRGYAIAGGRIETDFGGYGLIAPEFTGEE